MEMRKLDWAVEKSGRFGIFLVWFWLCGGGLELLVLVLWQRWVRKIDEAVELAESNGR